MAPFPPTLPYIINKPQIQDCFKEIRPWLATNLALYSFRAALREQEKYGPSCVNTPQFNRCVKDTAKRAHTRYQAMKTTKLNYLLSIKQNTNLLVSLVCPHFTCFTLLHQVGKKGKPNNRKSARG